MLRKLSSPQELWIPGQSNSLSNEYPTPSQEELAEKWREYDPDANILEAPGVYGVMTKPTQTPEVFISLDVCEVLRDTHLAIRSILFANEERFTGNIHTYGAGTCLEDGADITAVLRVMMTERLVKPVPEIKEIADIIEEAADNGAYIFANTSTLPGCEPGTIDFFKEHIPRGLKGVAFPRNHDGTLPLTKGVVLKNVVDEFSDPHVNVLAIHIDDSPHHNISARAEMAKRPNSQTFTFMPLYETHFMLDSESEIAETPLAAFHAMRSVLQSKQGF